MVVQPFLNRKFCQICCISHSAYPKAHRPEPPHPQETHEPRTGAFFFLTSETKHLSLEKDFVIANHTSF